MMRNSPSVLIDISGGASETPPDSAVPSAGSRVSAPDGVCRGSSAGGGDGMQFHPRREGGDGSNRRQPFVVPRGAERSQVVRALDAPSNNHVSSFVDALRTRWLALEQSTRNRGAENGVSLGLISLDTLPPDVPSPDCLC